jgi:hypothetical protein
MGLGLVMGLVTAQVLVMVTALVLGQTDVERVQLG